jgi:hypothetical protein
MCAYNYYVTPKNVVKIRNISGKKQDSIINYQSCRQYAFRERNCNGHT